MDLAPLSRASTPPSLVSNAWDGCRSDLPGRAFHAVVDIEVGRLPGGVHTGVGPSRDGELHVVTENGLQRRCENPFDGSQPGLKGPPVESCPVV